MSDRRTGQCLCGAVKVSAVVEAHVQACHCVQCQRWTGGGPYFAVPVSDLKVTGAETIAAYHASAWGERAYCGACGSTVFWRMQGKPARSMAVGLLDDQSGLSVTEEIFVDYRPGWLTPFEGASQSTEAQEQAKLEAYLAKDAKS
jgi:hypothetical protein